MSVPRLIVLTTAKPGELPRQYLADRDRFPMADLNTKDLGQARVWRFPPGVRRYIQRNPHLVGYRRVWVPEQDVKDALEKSGQPATLPTEAAPATGAKRTHGRASIRSTKTDPNKRMKRARRKAAIRTLRKLAAKPRHKASRKALPASYSR